MSRGSGLLINPGSAGLSWARIQPYRERELVRQCKLLYGVRGVVPVGSHPQERDVLVGRIGRQDGEALRVVQRDRVLRSEEDNGRRLLAGRKSGRLAFGSGQIE